jgi:hypothetical protein
MMNGAVALLRRKPAIQAPVQAETKLAAMSWKSERLSYNGGERPEWM